VGDGGGKGIEGLSGKQAPNIVDLKKKPSRKGTAGAKKKQDGSLGDKRREAMILKDAL